MSYSSVSTNVPGKIVCSISGRIVTWRTFSNICMATWPPRWIIPKMGGFSFSSVPRPRAPLSRFRRPLRRFFYRRGVSLMTRHDIDFVTLDGILEDRRGLTLNHPVSKLIGHTLHIVFVEIQLLGNLGVRQV